MSGKGITFKRFRIAVLLLVLGGVALGGWLARVRSTDWEQALWVVIYPINGDGSEVAAEYVSQLSVEDFQSIDGFMKEEAERFDLPVSDPVTVKLAPTVSELPPSPPYGGNVLEVVWWSLKLRRWASRVDTFTGPRPDIRIFVLYYDPQDDVALAHSLGLEEGLIGVVNAFASRRMSQTNNVVIAHEMLHTLGATDKYDPATNHPLFPAGYAEPDLSPAHPQDFAEIMGGRIPVSASTSEMPRSLDEVVIGRETAVEIKWLP
jgi:hypothetical protein